MVLLSLNYSCNHLVTENTCLIKDVQGRKQLEINYPEYPKRELFLIFHKQ